MPLSPLEFYGVANYRDPQQTELIEFSTMEYLKWCFTKVGGFIDAKYISPSNIDKLQRDSLDSKVYYGLRSQWCYETGVSGNHNPISISGVYVNGVLQTSGYSINYDAGKVIFDSAPSGNPIVRLEHSFRTPQIHKMNEWFKQIQYDSTNPLSPEFSNNSSGIYNILEKNRIQLPAILVHTPTRVAEYKDGYGLGSRTVEHIQPTILYIMTNNFQDNNRIHDILLNQKVTAYLGLDKKEILENNKYPLKYDGTINTSGLMYPDLSTNYVWKRIDVKNTKSKDILSLPNFHLTAVTWNTEILVN